MSLIKQIQQKYNEGEFDGIVRSIRVVPLCLGQPVVFEQYGDVHLAACVLKTFLRDLSEPLMTYRLYPELLGLSGSEYVLVLFSSTSVVTRKSLLALTLLGFTRCFNAVHVPT